jgi:uncharacterized membrane protein YuzA (DUF378 family)
MALGEMFFSEDSMFYYPGHALAGVGAVNWGLIGVTSLVGDPVNLVTALLGEGTMLTNVVYTLVGLGGIQVLGDSLMDLGVME